METEKIKRLARTFIKHTYDIIKNSDNTINDRYLEWLANFRLTHGELDTQRQIGLKEPFTLYDISIREKSDIFKLVYCLDNFYTAYLTLISAKILDKQFCYERINDYMNFTFFRKLGIINYHPPKNLIFYEKKIWKQFSITKVFKEINRWQITKWNNCDFIRELFHAIYPRSIRHNLGEFFTPDWLAEYIIKSSLKNLQGNVEDKKILDSTCGSGSFLINAQNLLRRQGNNINFSNLYGFDINPVSSFAAKTNLIINNFTNILKAEKSFLKVFTCNILEFEKQKNIAKENNILSFSDLERRFEKIASKSGSYTMDEILQLWNLEHLAAGLFKGADLIIGNPPWVNWEYLPNEYKRNTAHIWRNYGLFNHKGINSSFIKEDISALIIYVSIDNFLKDTGIISLLVKESLFKSAKQANGFRQFHLQNKNISFKVNKVEDLTNIKPFNGVNNKTVIFYAKKGSATQYPVEYIIWKAARRKKIKDTDSLKLIDIERNFKFNKKWARPLDKSRINSGWITVSKNLFDELNIYLGKSQYKARTGVFTGGANGIYWMKIINEKSKNTVIVENITEQAKIKFNKIQCEIEKDILYPYMSGSELSFWDYKYSKYIACPHDKNTRIYPFSEGILRKDYPKTFKYFKIFESALKARKGFTSFDKKIHESNFYTLQRIGDYTFAPYKFAWKYIASSFTCAVIEDTEDSFIGRKTIIPNEKIMYVGTKNKMEAYYLCGLLSSTIFSKIIDSFKISTQIAPSIIDRLNLPLFNPDNIAHIAISKACLEGHKNTDKIDDSIKIIDIHIKDALKYDTESSQRNSFAIPPSTPTQSEFTL